MENMGQLQGFSPCQYSGKYKEAIGASILIHFLPCCRPVEFARKDPEPRNEAHIHVKTADSSEEEDDMSPLHPNNNRPSIIYNMSDDESED